MSPLRRFKQSKVARAIEPDPAGDFRNKIVNLQNAADIDDVVWLVRFPAPSADCRETNGLAAKRSQGFAHETAAALTFCECCALPVG
ncbi:MAG: hypothetical protein AAFR28_18550, partial [Pseudomonadota bacterium]